ncbi:MAG: UDP-N-acetylmuramate--L-alanine ligase [Gammaproteobacteria bacterium]|nr:UDP-N-acetylmuramate--L-alanine ligase [Gammaproteobacteria bacterium]
MGKIKRIHFVGIGGAGMSGIADLLNNIGYIVSGSDTQQSKVTDYLSSCNIEVFIGHDKVNCQDADVVVRSTAIKDDNIEIITAKKFRIPVIPRAEMLAEMMRFRYGIAIAGTHGKTTTTSLVASILAQAELDPTFVIGGKLNSAGTNAKLGASPYLVAEADESDASFLHLQPMISVITNMEEDHMDTYDSDFSKLEATFIEFIHRLPFYGLVIYCGDDDNLRNIENSFGRRRLSYGLNNSNYDCYGYDLIHEYHKTKFKVKLKTEEAAIDIELNMPGEHNVLNALAGILVAKELNISDKDIQDALINFQGIGRRFQVHGNISVKDQNKEILMVDDYAHHPSEIKATIDAIRSGWPDKRLVVVFQPHRYTRTRDLYEDFIQVLSQVDQLLLMNVYAAGEAPIVGADSRCICRSIRNFGQLDPVLIQDEEDLLEILTQQLQDNDILLTLGAGNIGNLSLQLAEQLGNNIDDEINVSAQGEG